MSQEQLRDKVEEVIEPEQARYKLDEVLLTAARICESAGGVVDRAA